MSNHDKTLLFKMMKNDLRLKKLYDNHVNYKREISKLRGKSYLTMDEQQKIRELKYLKLRTIEKINYLTETAQAVC